MTLAALLWGVSATAFAQSNEKAGEYDYPHYFITLQGGAQATFTNYSFTDLITPQVALSFGRYFNPMVGVRLHVQGYEAKGGFKAFSPSAAYDGGYTYSIGYDSPYKFKAITGDLDLLVNMSNVLNPNRACNKLNWILLAGFGVNNTWGYDEYNSIVNTINNDDNNIYYVAPEQCSTKHSTFNGRIGTQVEYNLSRNFALSLELDANYKNDVFNLKVNDYVDWQVAAFVGVTYKFGMKKKPAPVIEETPAPAPPAPVVREEPKPAPAPVVKEEPLKETFFYVIRESDPSTSSATLDKIVEWCNKYPSKKITIKGYADKGTGNARVNARYAKLRAERVAKALQDRGIAADRMEVSSYGDTVQPFADNDSNRCTIVVGE